MAVRNRYVYKSGQLVAHLDWHEPDDADPPEVRAMDAKYPPVLHTVFPPLRPGEVAFDHPATKEELQNV
jgi:hypothetical protein